MWELLLTWLPVFGGILAGTILLPGIITGVYRSVKHIYGYTNDRLFGDDSNMGILSEFLLSGGIFSIGGGFLWLALVHEGKVSEINIHYGIYLGGIAGVIYIWIIREMINDGMNGVSLSIGWIIGGILGAIWGEYVGGAIGGMIGGMTGGKAGGTFDERPGKIVGGVLAGVAGGFVGGILSAIWGGFNVGIWTDRGIRGGGEVIGVFWGILGGIVSGIAQVFARLIVQLLALTIPSLLILMRFKTILCNHCFRYTHPLRSSYESGRRYCEHCQKEVERTKEAGKLIFRFGIFLEPSENQGRIFLISNPYVEKEAPMDVSDVYIDTKTCDRRILEQFITYIINYPPKHGLKSVKVFYHDDLDDLGENLKNALQNNFMHIRHYRK